MTGGPFGGSGTGGDVAPIQGADLRSADPQDVAASSENPWADAESDEPVDGETKDWAWVEEWREGGEPVPWGPGLTVAGFAVFLVSFAVYVLSAGLSGRPVLAVIVNLVVAVGLGPALWLSRGLPVLRWIAGGAVVGVLAGWVSAFLFLVA